MDIQNMHSAVSGHLERDVDLAVWQYFAGLSEYWERNVVEVLAQLFEEAEPEIECIFAEIVGEEVIVGDRA
jgi:hypothetical protein